MSHNLVEGSSIEADHLPLFEELHLVLIGCHGAGKNTVGNAILRKNVFTYRTTYERHNAKRERAVFGRRITIVRVPGWYGGLDPEKDHPEIMQEIRDGMKEFKNGPHAIILCVTESSAERIMKLMQNLFTEKVWEHTIIVFAHGKKKDNIDQHVNAKVLHPNLLKLPIFEQSRKLIEDIEEMIAKKHSVFNFCLPEIWNQEVCLNEKTQLLKKIQRKINLLDKEGSKDIKKTARVKAERARLHGLLTHVDKQIQILLQTCSPTDSPSPSPFDRLMSAVTTPLVQMINDPLAQTTKLQQEYDANDQMAVRSPPPYNCNESMTLTSPNSTRQDLHGWGSALVNVLDELKEQQFESMKIIIGFKDQWKLPRSKLDNSRAEVAELMIQTWGEHLCIINIRDIMKAIPRNDQAITSLIMPFLEAIGEKW